MVAAGWVLRTAETARRLREVPDLCSPEYGGAADGRLAVVVPALNEEAAVGSCLRSLAGSRGVSLEIVAVNDRSTDATGAIMDRVAAEVMAGVSNDVADRGSAEAERSAAHTMRVIHVEELPPGWLGKPHALALGARASSAPWVLFTDADAVFAPDALARALRYAEREEADHLVLLPTPILKSPGERMMMGAIQVFGMWGLRLWKVRDPRARDYLGVGCFNLLGRGAYEQIGGFERLRMEVLEDLRVGYLVKQHGLRQRVAFGWGLLRLHWAPGAMGIVHGLEKNLFAVWRYQVAMLVPAVSGLLLMTIAPVLGLLAPRPVRVPSAVAVGTILAAFYANARRTGAQARYGLLFPVASGLFVYAMLRSAGVTLARGGVSWRGTFYPLEELRAHAGRLWWWQVPSRTLP